MDGRRHVVRVGLYNHALAFVVNTGRRKKLIMIDAHRKLLFERVVDAITKRNVICRRAQADDLATAGDQFVVRTARIIRIRRQVMG